MSNVNLTKQFYWHYYRKVNSNKFDKRACCILCNNLIAYTSTSHNLKSHLKRRHHDEIDVNKLSTPFHETVLAEEEEEKIITALFKSVEDSDDFKCLLCESEVLISGDDRLSHVKTEHLDIFTKLSVSIVGDDFESFVIEHRKPSDQAASDSNESSDSNDPDVTDNFILLGRGRARCRLCHSIIPNRRGNMTAHMKKHENMTHSDSLKLDADNTIGDDPAYSEVVYLDEPLLNSTPNSNKRAKLRRKSTYQVKHEPKQQVHKRSHSPQQQKLTKHEEECEKFGTYIIHLLKSTPPDICSKLQMDIVALIMSEKIKIADSQKAAPATPLLLQKYVVKVNDIDTGKGGNDAEMSNMKELSIEASDQNAEIVTPPS